MLIIPWFSKYTIFWIQGSREAPYYWKTLCITYTHVFIDALCALINILLIFSSFLSLNLDRTVTGFKHNYSITWTNYMYMSCLYNVHTWCSSMCLTSNPCLTLSQVSGINIITVNVQFRIEQKNRKTLEDQ